MTIQSIIKKAIKRRYKKSLSHLSDRKKLSLGVAITELKIIKSFKKKLILNTLMKMMMKKN